MQEEFLRRKDVAWIVLSITIMILTGAYFLYGAMTRVRGEGEAAPISAQNVEVEVPSIKDQRSDEDQEADAATIRAVEGLLKDAVVRPIAAKDSRFRVGSGFDFVSSAPMAGLKTGLSEYPRLTWEDHLIHGDDGKDGQISIDMHYPKFIGGAAVGKLNGYVYSAVEGFIKDDEARFAEIRREDRGDYSGFAGLSLGGGYRVVAVDKGIVSIEMVVTDFTGGGNGNHDEPYVINWDLKSDRPLKPSELFCSADYISRLMPIVRKRIVEDFKKDPDKLANDEIISGIEAGAENNSENWQYVMPYKGGVVVVFPPYTVTSGAAGIVRAFVPASEIPGVMCLP